MDEGRNRSSSVSKFFNSLRKKGPKQDVGGFGTVGRRHAPSAIQVPTPWVTQSKSDPATSSADDSNLKSVGHTAKSSGTKLEELITIQGKLGDGMFGTCYKANLRLLNVTIVAKRIRQDKNPQMTKNVVKEIELLQKLAHENIVAYYGAYSFLNYASKLPELWIFTGYEAGGSLAELIERQVRLPETVSAVITHYTLKGLVYLNSKGIVHRNLRASNILLSEKGFPKISDFALAKSIEKSSTPSKTATLKAKSSSPWLAPEVLAHSDQFGPNCDSWSLGLTLHEMCDGSNPLCSINSMRMLVTVQGICGRWDKTFKNPSNWSRELNHFVESCLLVDQAIRPSPAQLLLHPWIERNKELVPSVYLAPLLRTSNKAFYNNQARKLKNSNVNLKSMLWTPEPDTADRLVLGRDQQAEIPLSRATLKKLIEYATNGNMPALETLLVLTYQTVCSAQEFFDLLIRRYQGSGNGPPSKEVQSSVGRIITDWIYKNPTDLKGTVLGRDLLYAVSMNTSLVEQLPIETLSQLELLQDEYVSSTDLKEWIQSHQKPDLDQKNPLELFAASPTEIAEQLTLLEWNIMNKILPNEFHKQAWNKKEAERRAPWLLFYVEWFNERSRWFSTAILKEEVVGERASLLEKFIDVADELIRLKNFNGALEVSACLFSAHITRLKQSWAKISPVHKQKFSKIEKLLNPTGNYKAYREILVNTEPPCLPYLGLMLTDLTFIDDANPDYIDKLINVEKIGLLGSSLKAFYRMVQPQYAIKKVPKVQVLLLQAEPWAEQDFFNISKMREDNAAANQTLRSMSGRELNRRYVVANGRANIDTASHFSRHDEKIMLSIAKKLKFKHNEVISGGSDILRGYFQVQEGSVVVERIQEEDAPIIVETFQPGEWFGEFALFQSSSHYNYRASSDKSVIVNFLDPKLMEQLLETDSQLSYRFWKRLSTDLAKRLSSTRKSDHQTLPTPRGSMEPESHSELTKIFDLDKSIVVLKGYNASLDHAKGFFYVTSGHLMFLGSLFGFRRKELLPVNQLKSAAAKGTVLLLTTKQSKEYEIALISAQDAQEAANLIDSLRRTSSPSSRSHKSTKKKQQAKASIENLAEAEPALSPGDWQKILQGTKSKLYQPGEEIIVQGTPGKQRIFQIVSGTCHIVYRTPTNEKHIFGILQAGQAFGVISFLTGDQEQWSVVSVQETRVVKLEGYFLNIVFQQHEEVAGRFFKFLAMSLVERLEETTEALSSKDPHDNNNNNNNSDNPLLSYSRGNSPLKASPIRSLRNPTALVHKRH